MKVWGVRHGRDACTALQRLMWVHRGLRILKDVYKTRPPPSTYELWVREVKDLRYFRSWTKEFLDKRASSIGVEGNPAGVCSQEEASAAVVESKACDLRVDDVEDVKHNSASHAVPYLNLCRGCGDERLCCFVVENPDHKLVVGGDGVYLRADLLRGFLVKEGI